MCIYFIYFILQMEAAIYQFDKKNTFQYDVDVFISYIEQDTPSKFYDSIDSNDLLENSFNTWFYFILSQIYLLIDISEEESVYHQEAKFLKIYLNRIFRVIEHWMDSFDEIFDDKYDKNKLFVLLRSYLFNNFIIMYQFIVHNCPSSKYLNNKDFFDSAFINLLKNNQSGSISDLDLQKISTSLQLFIGTK